MKSTLRMTVTQTIGCPFCNSKLREIILLRSLCQSVFEPANSCSALNGRMHFLPVSSEAMWKQMPTARKTFVAWIQIKGPKERKEVSLFMKIIRKLKQNPRTPPWTFFSCWHEGFFSQRTKDRPLKGCILVGRRSHFIYEFLYNCSSTFVGRTDRRLAFVWLSTFDGSVKTTCSTERPPMPSHVRTHHPSCCAVSSLRPFHWTRVLFSCFGRLQFRFYLAYILTIFISPEVEHC